MDGVIADPRAGLVMPVVTLTVHDPSEPMKVTTPARGFASPGVLSTTDTGALIVSSSRNVATACADCAAAHTATVAHTETHVLMMRDRN
jgi:hypothetical protein